MVLSGLEGVSKGHRTPAPGRAGPGRVLYALVFVGTACIGLTVVALSRRAAGDDAFRLWLEQSFTQPVFLAAYGVCFASCFLFPLAVAYLTVRRVPAQPPETASLGGPLRRLTEGPERPDVLRPSAVSGELGE